MEKEDYMRRAIMLAKSAEGKTSPNPMVGCVIVKNGKIISEACHEKYGEFHAERNALTRCLEDCEGADLYVTLEPCCHFGKTPPCTEIIINKKIARVFVGSLDVNPLVSGKGVEILRNHGLYVETGILEKECRKLNEVFYHFMKEKKPFVAMKYAMTLDGKIACESGDSKWVTGSAAREYVQVLRNRYTGIMVGINTVLTDDPMLDCRMEGGKNPTRIVCDSKLLIPYDCNLVKTAKEIPTIVACTKENLRKNKNKEEQLSRLGVEVIGISENSQQRIDIKELLSVLGARNIDSVLLEGGGTLNSTFLAEHQVHKVYAFLAPKLIGGALAKSPIEGKGCHKMSQALLLTDLSIETFGDDLCVIGTPKKEE